ALAGALISVFTVTPVLAAIVLPKHIEEVETIVVRGLRAAYTPVLRFALNNLTVAVTVGIVFLGLSGLAASRLGSEFL
ncbi:UNVERIFIED_CONTAM: efflux RND transporter permease subunit, partial [Bacteroidetes bacterium 56_B9]